MAETMDSSIYSPPFIIDPKKKDKVLAEWSYGNIRFKSIVYLSTTSVNERYMHFEVEVTRPEKESVEPVSYALVLGIYENLDIRVIQYNVHRLLSSVDSFIGGVFFDHNVPTQYKFGITKWKEIVPDQNQVFMNPLSTGGYIDKLWREQLLTDFVFKVKDQDFKVHKNILAAQSNVFRAMFTDENKMQENITNTAVITDISPKAFQQFLEYLYIRTQPTYDKHTLDLYKVAHKYDINELMVICESLIAPKVCQDNAMEMLEFANLFDITEIRKSAFEIIQKKIFPDDQLSPNFEYQPNVIRTLLAAKNERDNALEEAKKKCETESANAKSKYAAKLDTLKKLANNNNK